MYGNVWGRGRGWSITNSQEKLDAFVPIVLESSGCYINLLVFQKFTLIFNPLHSIGPRKMSAR